MVERYMKGPVVVQAVKWTGKNILEMCKFTGRDVSPFFSGEQLYLQTIEEVHHASIGDYIIKGVHGEFYTCKPDIFREIYEKVD